MIQIIGVLYILFLLTQIIAAFFVVFHLKRYTINHSMAGFMITVFSVVFLALLFTNIALFFAVPWQNLFSQSFI